MALWTVGSVLWLIVPRSTYDRLATFANASLERLDRSIGPRRSTDQAQPTQSRVASAFAASQIHDRDRPAQSNSASVATASRAPEPGQSNVTLRPVYRTTAQQLYRDYNANVVAIQTKIGTSRVRVTGNVAAIDQDAAGHPLVRLFTDKDGTAAAMTLTEDQRAAAAELVKNEAVEVECDKIGHSGDLLEGHGCTLALMDVRPKQVNLALFLANDKGATNVYVVGPMPEAACLTRADTISTHLHVNQRGEYVVWRGCTDSARENIAPGGCHLHSSPVTIPDIPPAHLWRYDCGPSTAARAGVRKKSTARAQGTVAVAMEPSAASADGTTAVTGLDESQDSTPAQTFAAPLAASTAVPGTQSPGLAPTSSAATAVGLATAAPSTTAIAPISTAAVGPPVPAPISAAKTAGVAPADHASTNNLRLASASNSDTGVGTGALVQAPVEEMTVAHAPQGSTRDGTMKLSGDASASRSSPPVAATSADDLAQVRAVDPQAADHIANYCANSVQDVFMPECRRREAEAWTRLVVQKEFPALDDATRKKCSEPPFPDTYVAKESCARYELHMN
jgi:hypothetical protein